MKYYIIDPQFHKPTLDRIKTSTIRGKAKVRVGERFALRFWTGRPYDSKMGTLGTAVCTEVSEIVLQAPVLREPEPGAFEKRTHELLTTWSFLAHINGRQQTTDGIRDLALCEGFPSVRMMGLWFKDHHKIHQRPMSAILTRWNPATFEVAP